MSPQADTRDPGSSQRQGVLRNVSGLCLHQDWIGVRTSGKELDAAGSLPASWRLLGRAGPALRLELVGLR